jgi:hypothetical protein
VLGFLSFLVFHFLAVSCFDVFLKKNKVAINVENNNRLNVKNFLS